VEQGVPDRATAVESPGLRRRAMARVMLRRQIRTQLLTHRQADTAAARRASPATGSNLVLPSTANPRRFHAGTRSAAGTQPCATVPHRLGAQKPQEASPAIGFLWWLATCETNRLVGWGEERLALIGGAAGRRCCGWRRSLRTAGVLRR